MPLRRPACRIFSSAAQSKEKVWPRALSRMFKGEACTLQRPVLADAETAGLEPDDPALQPRRGAAQIDGVVVPGEREEGGLAAVEGGGVDRDGGYGAGLEGVRVVVDVVLGGVEGESVVV